MLFRLYQYLLAAQEAFLQGGRRGLDALVRGAGWAPSWAAARLLLWRKAVPWLAGLAVLLVGLLFFQRALLPFVHEWQAQRFVAQAAQLAATGQNTSAAFRLRKALALHPQHPEATRLIAQLAEQEDSPTAVLWYWRLVSQPEATPADRLALARTALRFETPPYWLASNGLFAIPPLGRTNSEYAALLGAYYLKTGRPHLAEAQYELALRLAPANVALQVAWHTLRLASTNPQVARTSLQWLEQMTQDPQHGLAVIRSLREYYLGENHAALALTWAGRALAHPDAQFSDTLRHLQALWAASPEEVAPRTRQAWAAALAHPPRLAALLQWLLDTGQAPQALELWSALPPERQGHPDLRPRAVAAFQQTGRMAELARWLATQHWEQEDWRRRILLTRALRETGQEAEARQAWEEALALASERHSWLYETARLVQRWGWREALYPLAERALPFLCRNPAEILRWHALLEQLGDTAVLWRWYQPLADCQTHWLVLNNYAALSLLTGKDLSRAHHLARRLYFEQPQNTYCATTYAFSLHLQGQTTNGLAVLQNLPRNALERPVVAAYHGILLAATGQKKAALLQLDKAAQAPLLPEELALVERAREQARALPWPERRLPTPSPPR